MCGKAGVGSAGTVEPCAGRFYAAGAGDTVPWPALSRKLLETVDVKSLAVPPLMLAQAVEKGLRIKVAATLEADRWASAQRGNRHNSLIAETIIGDCLAAEQYFCHQPMTRSDGQRCYLGYHRQRNLAILDGMQ